MKKWKLINKWKKETVIRASFKPSSGRNDVTIKDYGRKLIYYDLNHVIFTVKSFIRSCFGDRRYQKMKLLNGKYTGKRCFIVATGPSLTLEDLYLIKDEITFGMNSLCGIFDKTDFRPTYYAIQDKVVFNKMKPYLDRYGISELLVGIANTHNIGFSDKDLDSHRDWIGFPLNASYHLGDMVYRDKYYVKYSSNAFKQVYDGYSITYSLIQLAQYMGFSEIYLLGVDCDYKKGRVNHIFEYGDKDSEHHDFQYQRMIKGYELLSRKKDELPFKIYNATRGGMLELFPRVTLEDIVREKNV